MSFWKWGNDDGVRKTHKRKRDEFDSVTDGYGSCIRAGISDNRGA